VYEAVIPNVNISLLITEN